MKMKLDFHIFAIAALGKGLSGGDRIFIEFARRLSKKNNVTIHVWKEGYEMCKRQELLESQNLQFDVISVGYWCRFGFVVCYFARIITACWAAFLMPLDNERSTVVYSASEFWMDSLPGFILKVRASKVRWLAGWFQTAPNPFVGFTKGNRKKKYKLAAFYQWFMQLPIKPLIARYADFVLVNNEEERKYFPELDKKGKAIVILGAVNVVEVEAWLSRHKKRVFNMIYTAVFQGRFHPQKGVLELIDIWKLVTAEMPEAKLAMIGDGPLMSNVKKRIKELGLEENIHLFGYIFDGDQKNNIFSQSNMVLHPAFFDSGGMASAEAMIFGLPCIGFNLKSYLSYYPKGMIKVAIGDLRAFADAIIKLAKNPGIREEIGEEARKMVKEDWGWDKRVETLTISLNK